MSRVQTHVVGCRINAWHLSVDRTKHTIVYKQNGGDDAQKRDDNGERRPLDAAPAHDRTRQPVLLSLPLSLSVPLCVPRLQR